MVGVMSAADALKHQFATGDRAPFEALFAPGCMLWHTGDTAEVPAANRPGAAVLREIVDDLHADIVQLEDFASGSGQMIRLVMRGTVRESGQPLEAHSCIVLTVGDKGITRIDEYIDPTLSRQLHPGSN